MKVGLVLGAGGVVGASWLIGALQGVEEETGWAPRSADRIVGTSAGAVIGSLCAAGVSPKLIGDYSTGDAGEAIDEVARVDDLVDETAGHTSAEHYRLARALPPIGPGSLRMALSTLRHPRRHSPALLVSGWLPRGFISTEPIKQLVERFTPASWPDHEGFWAVACDYEDGGRVAFGREDAPAATIGDAVAASCAIPAFYQPVKINGKRYVDGGIISTSNLDLLADEGLDLVVCLNPMSSRAHPAPRSAGERVAAAVRGASGRRLGHEAKLLRAGGTHVLLLQPSRADLAVMGVNLMARDRRAEVIETARASTIRALRRLGDSEPLPRPVPAARVAVRRGAAPARAAVGVRAA
jgi:NTE family protein